MRKKKISEKLTPLQKIIIEILDLEKLEDISPVAQLGIAILLIVYYQQLTGRKESDYLNDYLDAQKISYSDRTIEKVFKIIREQKLIKNEKLNPVGSEDLNSPVTWCLWCNLFEGFMTRKVKNGEAYYKLTSKGVRNVLEMAKEINKKGQRE